MRSLGAYFIMPIDVHTLELGDGSTFNRTDRVQVWRMTGIVNAAGGGEGDAVTTAVSVPGVALPASYDVFVDTNGQAAVACATNKTNTGFDVVLQPPATVTLVAGSFDVLVLA